MSDTIIRVENLGKKYLIKHQQQGSYTALRDVIADKVKSLSKRIISPLNHKQSSTYSTTEEFWALKDVSFEVKQGEVIGIIGRNGAGKSTLLKVLSRITEPTTGRITIKGRVASLLEVGTGFHPELTGRENIFLNGAILGMGKAEIKSKFDEIVNFAEVERFLDTPVKRYSSGMYVRLAFAVAAHLEPEILVVDEVLAVGDAEFQKKCLGKMKQVGKEGRTVLFVSHNMDMINRLCQRGVLLRQGELFFNGGVTEAVGKYINSASNEAHQEYDYPEPKENVDAYIYKMRFENIDGTPASSFPVGRPWQARAFFRVRRLSTFLAAFGMYDKTGIVLRSTWTAIKTFTKGDYYVVFCEKELMLTPGNYPFYLHLHRAKGQRMFSLLNAGILQIRDITENIPQTVNDYKWGVFVNQLAYKFGKVE